MDKKKLSERDICSKFINPALEKAEWTAQQIREEVTFTNSQIMVRDNAKFNKLNLADALVANAVGEG